MDLSEMQTRVAELEQQISALPAGSVTKKTVNGSCPRRNLRTLLRLLPMSAPARRCVPLRHLFAAIAGASASGNCTTLSAASRRTRCSFSTACAGRVKPP